MDIKNLENLLKNESCFLSSDGKLLKSKKKSRHLNMIIF